ncbi:unnamed protein product [Notodromas monacha]|uniref:Charged multivesicular body protein 6 n=1 Tax=Notodromas monacha TaxID=399045 RepID=A0A7R9BHD9_9CRUS|nr:unnamed protein product [Notodromas monacha]CAG0914132.1 unnamed protein product [Notodromas monacha]
MGIFSSKSKKPVSRVTEQDIAVLQLKQQRDELRKYQKRIEAVMEKDRMLARKLLSENQRERAKLLLRKKRFQEDLLEKTSNQMDNLERLVSDIEFKQVEMNVVEGLRVGNESLKRMNAMMDIAEIEKILDETQEGAEKQEEINAMLRDFSASVEGMSDEDLDNELKDLLHEDELSLPEPPRASPESIVVPADTQVRVKVKKQKMMEPQLAS